MLSPEIQSKINQLWDRFLSGGISNPITAIEQISNLLFLKYLDDLDLKMMREANSSGKKYEPIFTKVVTKPEGLRTPRKNEIVYYKADYRNELRWSNFKNIAPKAMLEKVADEVFPYLKELSAQKYPALRYFTDAVFLIPKPSLLDEAVKKIEEIHKEIIRQNQDMVPFPDTIGDVYEYLLAEVKMSVKEGQFRTPRHLIRLITEIIEPEITDRICDPVCGSGGFLVGAYQSIVANHSSANTLSIEDENGFRKGLGDKIKTKRDADKLRMDTFYGFDVDKTMVRFALLNLMLHHITQPGIEYQDILSEPFGKKTKSNKYSVILANPPFKNTSENTATGNQAIKIDALFLQRIMSMLEPGGRAAVIVPENFLIGVSKEQKEIRRLLLQTCELKAVISLPQGVFKPYTGIKTSILIFHKSKSAKKNLGSDGKGWCTQQVWFYKVDSDGYSLDDNRQKLNEKPLPEIVTEYNDYVKGRKKSLNKQHKHFHVPIREIIDTDCRLSQNRYELLKDDTSFEPPKEILGKLMLLEKEIQTEMESLNELLK